MAELTGDEKKVLDLVSRKRSLTLDQTNKALAEPGTTATQTEAVESLVKKGRLVKYSRGSKTSVYPVGQSDSSLISFWTLRRLVGYIGVGLPEALWLGNFILGDLLNVFKTSHGIQGSVSAYYYTGMRNVFVGAICAIAVFLICNRGYDKWDNIRYKLAGFLALGVPLFPTKRTVPPPPPLSGQEQLVGTLHLVFTISLFCMLALICFRTFTKPDFAKELPDFDESGELTQRKRRRNFMYNFYGAVILLFIILIIPFDVLQKDTTFLFIPTVFLFEGIALLAFGTAWLAKGRVYLLPQLFGDET